MAGSLIKVAPLWNELQVADWPVVYQGSSKSHLTNLTVGDTVLAAGPSEMDIRFIWVQDKVQSSNVIEAVVANISGRQEKAFFEITPSGLGTYPYYAASHTTFGYPAGKRTLRASELQPGDRVKLWVDGQRTVIWGEVTEKTDTRATGIYLGGRTVIRISAASSALTPEATLSSPAFPMMPLRSLAPKCWWRALAVCSRIWRSRPI